MSEASEYVANLVEFGKHDYADLGSVELEEVALLIYKEAKDVERQDLIMDSKNVTDFFSLLFPAINDFNPGKVENFKKQAKKCLVEMTEMRVKELLHFAIDDLEENNRLQQQDSEYVEFKERNL